MVTQRSSRKAAVGGAKSSYGEYKLTIMVAVLTHVYISARPTAVIGGAIVHRKQGIYVLFYPIATHGHVS